MQDVSIIIPTYNEANSLPELTEEIFSYLKNQPINCELIFVDDASPDGTGSIAEKLKDQYPVQVIHRPKKIGLGGAVIAGFSLSSRSFLGVMDADLSHDPKVLIDLILSLNQYDLTIGSRLAPGGQVENWPWPRKLVSYLGTFFARRLTKVKDPLSGYFFMRREVISGVELKTTGYKILLEILVKGHYRNIKEIPFIFRSRKFSASKLGAVEFFKFAKQLLQYSAGKIFNSIRQKKSG